MNAIRININGVETRRKIGELAGKKEGIDKLCTEKGLPSEPINLACLKGYATPEVIVRYTQAGIPVVISKDPVPSRVKVRHSRINTTKQPEIASEKHDQISLEEFTESYEAQEIDKADIIKELLIKKLSELIEELKKI